MKAKTSKLLQQLLNGVLILAILVMIGLLSVRYKAQLDWTAGGRNTLTAASQTLLKQMPGPIQFIALLRPSADTRRDIEMMIGRYARAKPDVSLSFVDPDKHPELKQQYENLGEGGIVVQYQDRHEILDVLSESAVTGALQRLMDKGDHYVVFLEGHGEHSINPDPAESEEGHPQSGYSQFAQTLRQKGLKVEGLNLAKTPSIPDNAVALVVASPQKKLLDGEIKLIDDYVKAGGNLLWLSDPGQPAGLDAVAKTLGVNWENGFALFPDYQELNGRSPLIYVAPAGEYPPNPVTRDLPYTTLFPLVRPLTWNKDADRVAGWEVMPLLQTNQNAWLKNNVDFNKPIALDEQAGDKSGSLTLAITMSRQIKNEAAKEGPGKAQEAKTQRVILLGDSDFLTDANLQVAGNELLGVNLVQWLASRDALLNIDVPKAQDPVLNLSPMAMLALAVVFFPVVPLGLLGYGIVRWVRRRRR